MRKYSLYLILIYLYKQIIDDINFNKFIFTMLNLCIFSLVRTFYLSNNII